MYNILSGSLHILVTVFLSVIVCKEHLTRKAAISLLLSLGAVILSLL